MRKRLCQGFVRRPDDLVRAKVTQMAAVAQNSVETGRFALL